MASEFTFFVDLLFSLGSTPPLSTSFATFFRFHGRDFVDPVFEYESLTLL